jgi:hypothetical protein
MQHKVGAAYHQGEFMARMEDVDEVLEKHFPEGLEGAEAENFEQAQQELARLFEGRVDVEGECTWDSTRPLGDKLRCNIKVTFKRKAEL